MSILYVAFSVKDTVVISLLRKIGFKEMNVQKFRNVAITGFVKSGIHCTLNVKALHDA